MNTSAQQATPTNCQVQIDRYTVPLLGDFSGIREKMPLEEDVEIANPNQWGYFYTADITETAHYTLNPEVAFEGNNVDAAKITKQSFNYIIEIPRRDAKDAQKILGEVFKVIGGQLPFLNSTSMNAGERKRIPCTCATCEVVVSRPRAAAGGITEIEINVRLTPQTSIPPKK